MTTSFNQAWIPLPAAAAAAGVSHWVIRRLVKAGVFTRVSFSPAAKKPPIFLSVRELDAFKAGGVDAVRKYQARAAKRSPKR